MVCTNEDRKNSKKKRMIMCWNGHKTPVEILRFDLKCLQVGGGRRKSFPEEKKS